MAAISKIGTGPRSTNLGPPPNFDKVSKIGTGYAMATNTPGATGAYEIKTLRDATQTNGITAQVVDSFVATARMRIVSVQIGAAAVTATAAVLIYNSTQAANVIASQTPTTTPTAVTTITTPTVEIGDVIQMKSTTSGGSGAYTNLVADITAEFIGDPTNAQA